MVARAIIGAALAAVLSAPPAWAGHLRGYPYWVEAKQRTLRAQRSEMSRVARAALPAVVAITAIQDGRESNIGAGEPLKDDGPQKAVGAGFIIHPDGYILTSAHVVEGARQITAQLLSPDGSSQLFLAQVIGQDAETDCALLKISAGRRLPVLELGTSRDVDIADWVVVIGNPFGLAYSVSVGVVSFKGRTDVTPSGRDGYFDYLQTDAAINPGNSGGPVLDISGQVVAIANAVNISGQGIGFAVPIDTAKAILPQLYAHGQVRRAWLGASVEDVAPADGSLTARAVRISEVIPNSPAERAGLVSGDLILGVNHRHVEGAHRLRWDLAISGVGRTVDLTVKRHGRERHFKVRLEDSPSEVGLAVDELSLSVSPKAGLAPSGGALVRQVAEGSAAAGAGLASGDVVIQLNRSEVSSGGDLISGLSRLQKGAPVDLRVWREGRTLDIRFLRP